MQKQNYVSIMCRTAVLVVLPLFASAQEAVEEVPAEAEVIPLSEWGYEDLYAEGLSIEELLEANVNNATGEDIGDVENVVFSEDGRVLSVVAEVGGFLDIGDTHVNIPWELVEAAEWDEGIEVPITEETVDDYSLFDEGILTAPDAATDIQEVEGDGLGEIDTGPRAWRATELIGDYTRLEDATGFINYGYVEDIIIRDGEIAAVQVIPDVTWGAGGYYAYPFYGYGYGWEPGVRYYDLPYERAEVEELEPFDEELLLDD